MIPHEFYCPECDHLWDKETCEHCGYIAEETLKTPRKRIKQKQEQDEGKDK